MIQYYKINKSVDQVNRTNPPKVNNNSNTRRLNQKITKDLISSQIE
jgi:hypothetical protein